MGPKKAKKYLLPWRYSASKHFPIFTCAPYEAENFILLQIEVKSNNFNFHIVT